MRRGAQRITPEAPRQMSFTHASLGDNVGFLRALRLYAVTSEPLAHIVHRDQHARIRLRSELPIVEPLELRRLEHGAVKGPPASTPI